MKAGWRLGAMFAITRSFSLSLSGSTPFAFELHVHVHDVLTLNWVDFHDVYLVLSYCVFMESRFYPISYADS